MNKCEHGQKITLFCRADNCQYKQGGGCEVCLKKYHNHASHNLYFNEEEMLNLMKKFSLDNTVKPKCRLLQESIYNYFNQVKGELSGSLDIVCKNIINQIGYPYLFSNNVLSTFKKMKNKQYKKLSQKECRAFYEIATKVGERQLGKEQNRIYNIQVKTTNEVITQLESIIKNYEEIVKNYHVLERDHSQLFKVAEIIKSLTADSPGKNSRKSNDVNQKGKDLQKINLINATPISNYASIKYDFKSIDSKANELKSKIEKIQADIQPLLHSPIPPTISTTPPFLIPPKNHNGRDVSLDKRIKQNKVEGSIQTNASKDLQSSDSRLPNQKIQTLKIQLNNREIQINQKKKLLRDIMKHGDKAERHPQYQSLKPNYSSVTKRETTETKSINESISSDEEDQRGKSYDKSKNRAFTKLPIQENIKKAEEERIINKKFIIIPTEINGKNGNSSSHKGNNEVDSPIYKKRNKQLQFDEPFDEKNQLQRKRSDSQVKVLAVKQVKQIRQAKDVKQSLEIKQNQQKSLTLLLKSLTLNVEQAIVYLQSSLKYADNNLSAAQYLSYLYLQVNRPKDCLALCNKFLDKIDNCNDQSQFSININNNKAAALNILGRYSQAILILQQCLKYKQKDSFYKNLADSYLSIGMLDKARVNYQKSIKMNPSNDECHYNLAVCLYMQQNYENSKWSIRRAIDLRPKEEAYLQLEGQIGAKIKPA